VNNHGSMDRLTVNEVKTHAVKSVKWTALGEIASRSIQPLVMLILARLLTPADFGVVGVAMIAIGFAQIFQDFGLGKTLIQRETEVEKSANIIFWTNITLSFFIYLILFISAPLLSKFFHEPKVIDVLRVLCLQIVLLSFVSVHQALFQRNFQFKQLFFIRLLSAVVPGLVSIPMAIYGYGVWALVFGTLAGSVVQVFIYWQVNRWRPKLTYDLQLVRQLMEFGKWVTLEASILWLLFWGDSTVLGHFLGVKELGVYRVGITFLMFVFGIFFDPLIPVAYSSFSRLQLNQEELKQSFLKMTKLIASISLPIGVVLVTLGPTILSVVFGQKWHGIEIVIMILSLKDALTWLVGLNPEVLRAIGRPDIYTKIWMALSLFYIPTYILAAPHGIKVFCISRLGVSMIGLIIQILVMLNILKLSINDFFTSIIYPFFLSIFLALVLFVLSKPLHLLPVSFYYFGIFIIFAVSISIYLVTFRLLDKNFFHSILKLIKEAL